ncbi:MAG: F0F1 ATP synthase subunit A [Deltaproteobacteria bacterium]|nr:F0F1 ATP synthase subunit A [Deltaproteobacteria bacterium]
MHDFTWLGLISNKIDHSNIHVFTSALVVFFILLLSFLAHRRLKYTKACLVPEDKTTIANIFEVAVENILGLMKGVMGADAPKYFPLIGALFIYIFLCNLVSLIPGFLPPTDNINTNLACSLTVFVYYNIMGIRAHGLKAYLKHFMGPILWLGPLMFVIEMIGHLVRPVSLALRLFGNITGDHLVLGIFSDLTPILVPIIFLALGLFVAFIQAFVFSLLSTIYIALATAHEHEEGH